MALIILRFLRKWVRMPEWRQYEFGVCSCTADVLKCPEAIFFSCKSDISEAGHGRTKANWIPGAGGCVWYGDLISTRLCWTLWILGSCHNVTEEDGDQRKLSLNSESQWLRIRNLLELDSVALGIVVKLEIFLQLDTPPWSWTILPWVR